MKKICAAIMADNVPFYQGDILEYVYGSERLQEIRVVADLFPERITSLNIDKLLSELKDVEAIFSCWGMLSLTEEQLDKMPNLKIVFYASGSVVGFSQLLMKRGIAICSAVDANAIPVAEFCLAQIILACKRAHTNSQLCNSGPWKQQDMPVGKGVYGETVALLGIGAISRHLIKLLKSLNLRIIAVSGYLAKDPAKAKEMGIDKLVTTEEAFSTAYVVSNHLPDKSTNKGVLQERHFSSMREGATFINTGRGAQVDELGLIKVLKSRFDLTALLDVQFPEPPIEGSELYTLKNVHMTSHIAGSINDEVRRMADFMISDFKRWAAVEQLLYAVDAKEMGGRA